MATEEEILASRRRRAERLAAAGVELFPARVPRELDRVSGLLERYSESDAETLEREAPQARIAGRILSLRSFGKAAFATLVSDGARLQIWVKRDVIGEEAYAHFGLYEVGDFVWAAGPLIRTRKGELSIEVKELGFLAKSYRPLPEKWHGLQDVEARYRQRYLDLLMNPDARRIAVGRSRMVAAIRRVLDERGFLEVETPVLQNLYGGANATPFTTHYKAYDEQVYLRISLELYLKRLVVGGLERVYEIGRNFRNEGADRSHNPEFSMLEVYQAYADYEDMMELAESLISQAAYAVCGGTRVERDGEIIDLAPPWPRISMKELIASETGIDIEVVKELDGLKEAVKSAGLSDVDAERAPSWARLVDEIWSQRVEPGLLQPTFVVDYPTALSPLAKRLPGQTAFVERFELFAGGTELANAFSELNDPFDQRERFEAQRRERESGDAEAQPLDEEFLRALEHGMPPTGGMGIGVGRVAMMLTGASHIREVKLFPYMRRAGV
ncbi:MAG: lysine--tRNA ligase [Myxococcota bacterium]|nr:lysine--tRNA ligase [Myxococcota bacterium]